MNTFIESWQSYSGNVIELSNREDGPAIERIDGTKEWYLNGNFHREDGPAFEHANGKKEWYSNDQFYR